MTLCSKSHFSSFFSVVSINVLTKNWLPLAALCEDAVSGHDEILTFSQALTFSVGPD